MSLSPAPPLLLASTSPQRRAILEQLRIPFDVVAPDYEEAPGTIRSNARPARRGPSTAATAPVLGVDTEVLCGGELLGKPADAAEAEGCWRRSRGDARGRLRPLPADAGLGGARTRRRRVSPSAAHAARPRALPCERRVGGPRRRLRDPGPRRRPRRADRGRLPERRRAARRAPRPAARERFSGVVRLRLRDRERPICHSARSAIPAKTSADPASRPRGRARRARSAASSVADHDRRRPHRERPAQPARGGAPAVRA